MRQGFFSQILQNPFFSSKYLRSIRAFVIEDHS